MSSGPGVTDLEDLQGWILKFGEDIKNLFISIEIFVNCPANKSLPFVAYRTCMSSSLIMIDKQPGVCPVGVGGNWRCLFAKCVLRVMGPKATNTWQYDQLCAGLKVGFYVAIHGVKAIWYANSST